MKVVVLLFTHRDTKIRYSNFIYGMQRWQDGAVVRALASQQCGLGSVMHQSIPAYPGATPGHLTHVFLN